MLAPQRMAATISTSFPAPADYLCGLTWDGANLWHSDQGAERIYAIDPGDGRLLRSIDCPWVRADLTFDGEHLCQVGGRPKRLVLIDPRDGQVVGTKRVLPADGRLTGAELGPEGLWLCLRDPTVVQLRDYATMRVLREFPAQALAPAGLTYANGTVVYADHDAGLLHAMRPDDGGPAGVWTVPGRPTGVAFDGQRLWYCDFASRTLCAVELAAAR